MVLDFSDFDRRFKDYIHVKAPAGATRGMRKATLQLLNDTIMRVPTVPLDKGTLRSTGTVHVGNSYRGGTGWPDGAPDRGFSANRGGAGVPDNTHTIVGTVGFNTDYAAWTHETDGVNWQEPGAGSRYIVQKLATRYQIYFAIIAKEIFEVK